MTSLPVEAQTFLQTEGIDISSIEKLIFIKGFYTEYLLFLPDEMLILREVFSRWEVRGQYQREKIENIVLQDRFSGTAVSFQGNGRYVRLEAMSTADVQWFQEYVQNEENKKDTKEKDTEPSLPEITTSIEPDDSFEEEFAVSSKAPFSSSYFEAKEEKTDISQEENNIAQKDSPPINWSMKKSLLLFGVLLLLLMPAVQFIQRIFWDIFPYGLDFFQYDLYVAGASVIGVWVSRQSQKTKEFWRGARNYIFLITVLSVIGYYFGFYMTELLRFDFVLILITPSLLYWFWVAGKYLKESI